MTVVTPTRPLDWAELGFDSSHNDWPTPEVHGWAHVSEALHGGGVSTGVGVYVVGVVRGATHAGAWPVGPTADAVGMQVVYVGRSERLRYRMKAFIHSAGLDPKYRRGHHAAHRLHTILPDGCQPEHVRFAWITPGGDAVRSGDVAYLWSTLVEALVLARVSGRERVGTIPVLQHRGWAPIRVTTSVSAMCDALAAVWSGDDVTAANLIDLGAERIGHVLAAVVDPDSLVYEEHDRCRGWKLGPAGDHDLWLYVGTSTRDRRFFATLWSGDRQVYPAVHETTVDWEELPSRAAEVLGMALVGAP